MSAALLTAIIGNVPSLIGFAVLSWFLAARLRRCEDARDQLAREHSDFRVRIAVLETAFNGRNKQ